MGAGQAVMPGPVFAIGRPVQNDVHLQCACAANITDDRTCIWQPSPLWNPGGRRRQGIVAPR
jgi:hypothetical protein